MTTDVRLNGGNRSLRNSRVELLRILGIVLILLNHTLQSDILPQEAFPWSVLSCLLSRLGGTGDVLFFGITAYYLCVGKPSTPRVSLRRVWLLERQLLCYSAGLFVFTLLAWLSGYGFNSYSGPDIIWLFARSCMPLLSAFWWYPSAYAAFLVAQPFLDRLLEAIGRRNHALCSGFLFVLLSVPIPKGPLNLGWTSALFVYQYVVFSYVVRYLRLPRRTLVLSVTGSALLGIVLSLISGITGNESMTGGYMNIPQTLVPMVFGFSLVLLAADSKPFSNGVVNHIASCAFAAYLIQCYPSMSLLIGKAVGVLAGVTGDNWPLRLVCEIAVALLLFVVAIAVDSLRQGVFRMTVDCRRGALFDRLWRWVGAQIACNWA